MFFWKNINGCSFSRNFVLKRISWNCSSTGLKLLYSTFVALRTNQNGGAVYIYSESTDFESNASLYSKCSAYGSNSESACVYCYAKTAKYLNNCHKNSWATFQTQSSRIGTFTYLPNIVKHNSVTKCAPSGEGKHHSFANNNGIVTSQFNNISFNFPKDLNAFASQSIYSESLLQFNNVIQNSCNVPICLGSSSTITTIQQFNIINNSYNQGEHLYRNSFGRFWYGKSIIKECLLKNNNYEYFDVPEQSGYYEVQNCFVCLNNFTLKNQSPCKESFSIPKILCRNLSFLFTQKTSNILFKILLGIIHLMI